jgi:hypothetical protein
VDNSLKASLANARFEGPILVQGRGGAGNQLFQYAAALSLAKSVRNPGIYWIPTDAARRVKGCHIEDFVGPLPRARASDLIRFFMPPWWIPPSLKRTNRALRRKLRIGRVVWREQRANRLQTLEVPYTGNGLLVNAFCQSLDYIDPALAEVSAQVLRLRPLTANAARGVVALSFRLGEFRRLGWTPPIDYYLDALKILDPRRKSKLWIITDAADEQAQLVSRFAAKGWQIQKPPNHECRPELIHFWNLCIAEKIILSCSTFTWWAALVGDFMHASAGRMVAFPDPWLPKHNDNLCLQRWIKVPYSGQGM